MNQTGKRFPDEELTPDQQADFLSFKAKFDPTEAQREYGELLRNAANLTTLEQLLHELREIDVPSSTSR